MTINRLLETCSRIMGAKASKERREQEILAARLHLYGEFDTVIKCEETEMPCHREVLMEHSAYFRYNFKCGIKSV